MSTPDAYQWAFVLPCLLSFACIMWIVWDNMRAERWQDDDVSHRTETKGRRMSTKVIFESDSLGQDGHVARIELELHVDCMDEDGCDATYEVESIRNVETGLWLDEHVFWDALPADERGRCDVACQRAADEAGPDAYREWVRGRADALYDAWKDGDT